MNQRRTSTVKGNSLASRRNILLLVAVAAVVIAAVYFLTRSPEKPSVGFDKDQLQDRLPVVDRQAAGGDSQSGEEPVADRLDPVVEKSPQADRKPSPVADKKIKTPERDQYAWVRKEVVELVGERNARMVYPGNRPLQQMVGVLASAAEGQIIARQVRFWREAQNFGKKFPVRKSRGLIYMDEKGYKRFDRLVTVLTDIDTQFLVSLFNRIEPTLQKAYRLLGYKRGNVRTLLRSSIDNVLGAPVIEEPIPLKRDSVNYKFADADLERHSPVEKQLIRMGPTNVRKLQKWLKSLRNSI